MHTQSLDPTRQTYATLQAAWSTSTTTCSAAGCRPAWSPSSAGRTRSATSPRPLRAPRRRAARTDEIALNPKHIIERPPEDTLSTLVHEMVHLRQQRFGKPGRGRYHNAEWAGMMSEVGLSRRSTGKPGGKRTGDRVSHYIVAGGPFDRACQAFLAKNPGLLWGDRPVERTGSGGKRAKYICADRECRLAAWARPGVQFLCNEHENAVPMIELATPPV